MTVKNVGYTIQFCKVYGTDAYNSEVSAGYAYAHYLVSLSFGFVPILYTLILYISILLHSNIFNLLMRKISVKAVLGVDLEMVLSFYTRESR